MHFPSLGKDCVLVVPAPTKGSPDEVLLDYSSVCAFQRNAPPAQRKAFWQRVSEQARESSSGDAHLKFFMAPKRASVVYRGMRSYPEFILPRQARMKLAHRRFRVEEKLHTSKLHVECFGAM